MTPYDFHKIQAHVRAFSAARNWGQFHNPRSIATALSVEAIELLETCLGDSSPQALQTKAPSEVSDILAYAAYFCDMMGIMLPHTLRSPLTTWHRDSAMKLAKHAGNLSELLMWLNDEKAHAAPHDATLKGRASYEVLEVLAHLIHFGEQLGIDPVAAFWAKQAKLEERYPVNKVRALSAQGVHGKVPEAKA
jgi:NTP pyrophosphatase (non-canonical NTP hydrolase)